MCRMKDLIIICFIAALTNAAIAFFIAAFLIGEHRSNKVTINQTPSVVGKACLDSGGTLSIKLDEKGQNVLQISCDFPPQESLK